MDNPLAGTLTTDGPRRDLGEHARTYGRLIGDWQGTLEDYTAPGGVETQSIEIHFGWVLEGRAVQDVWIAPARAERASGSPRGDRYGTTLRVFEPATASWRVLWWNPVNGGRVELEGRAQGDDIVQIGHRGGRPIRWTFSEISEESFLWQGHVLDVDGATWQLEVIIRARRTGAAGA